MGFLDVRVLLTAFEPYDVWKENSSWLTLVEVLKLRPADADLVTRRYPVDYETLKTRLFADLSKGFDVVLHLGQSPGAPYIKLEALAINVAGNTDSTGTVQPPLIEQGPLAFQTSLPVARWNDQLMQAAIPSAISYHAGTFLCNAAMYLSHYWQASLGKKPAVGFIHLPLCPHQVVSAGRLMPSLPLPMMAQGVRLILDDLFQKPSTIV